MKNNKKVLNEAFFKKDSYSDKVEKGLPAYTPVGSDSTPGTSNSGAAVFAVTDAKEMKKRLANTFGAAFGDNNIRSMATKSLKTFPIIVSDNVEPETVISLKKLVEEQYADYISLLISNQVIDLSAYEASDRSNGETIAIQALDKISGTDFSSTRVANKAANTGNVTPDDVFANVPLYNLLREHNQELKTGDELIDKLLEDALVVPSTHVGDVVKYINNNSLFESEMLDEALLRDYDSAPSERDRDVSEDSASRILAKYAEDNGIDIASRIDRKDNAMNKALGIELDNDQKEVYKKLTNTDIVINPAAFTSALNKTIGEFLLDPKNAVIKDRFEKASILLQSEMIAGTEFIDYCTIRLGIPMSAKVRQEIVSNFRRVKAIDRNSSDPKDNIFLTKERYNRIIRNEKIYGKIAPKILGVKVGHAILAGVTGGAAGAGVAAAVGAGSMSLAGAALLGPIGIGVLAGAAVGAGAYLIYKLINARKKRNTNKIEGWERVESLIDAMEQQRASVIANAEKINRELNARNAESPKSIRSTQDIEDMLKSDERAVNNAYRSYQRSLGKEDPERPLTGDELDELQKSLGKYYKVTSNGIYMTEGTQINEKVYIEYNQNYIDNFLEDFKNICEECEKDELFRNTLLSESIFTKIRAKALERKLAKGTSTPMKTKYVTKNNNDVLITPEFSARSNYAYGTTEIDRKTLKDRRYNQPLLMTIKFRERMDDGKFSDNELTAVIGILGKVIRVPSEEMKYILTSNAEGETIKGIFKPDADLKNLVSDLLTTSKVSKDVKNLPQSADVWKNLEKVASLAVANKMAGKKSNNIANAHIIFSEKEIDEARLESGVDYKRDVKLATQLMKRYSAFTLMIADDAAQRMYMLNDADDISWNVVPFSAIIGKDTGDQLTSALAKLGRI